MFFILNSQFGDRAACFECFFSGFFLRFTASRWAGPDSADWGPRNVAPEEFKRQENKQGFLITKGPFSPSPPRPHSFSPPLPPLHSSPPLSPLPPFISSFASLHVALLPPPSALSVLSLCASYSFWWRRRRRGRHHPTWPRGRLPGLGERHRQGRAQGPPLCPQKKKRKNRVTVQRC